MDGVPQLQAWADPPPVARIPSSDDVAGDDGLRDRPGTRGVISSFRDGSGEARRRRARLGEQWVLG